MAATSAYLFSSATALTQIAGGDFSMCGWFNPAATGPFAALTIILAPDWKICLDASGLVHFDIFNSATNTTTNLAASNSVVPDWNFIAVTYQAASKTMTLYVNGEITTTTATEAPDDSISSYTTEFQLGTNSLDDPSLSTSATFDLDEVIVWSRVLTANELSAIYAGSQGNIFPLSGGNYNMIFQANLINTPQKPVVVATDTDVWGLTTLYNSANSQYEADLDLLFSGTSISDGFAWTADNFNDVVVLAEHDNPAQYWLPPYPNTLQLLPGLPSDEDVWDGVAVFQGHVLLWQDETLKWSDLNDYTSWIPVAQTVVSAALTLASPFVQPPPGGNVSVTVLNPVSTVVSLTVEGNLTFGGVTVGQTESLLVNIVNTGTSAVTVTGISLPTGFTGSYSGTIPVGGSAPLVVTFAPTAVISYDGALTVASNATEGTFTLPISGQGVGTTLTLSLSGILAFGNCVRNKTLASSMIITNTGNASVTVSSITLPTGFTGSYSGSIAAGAMQAVPITFAPTNAQSYTGSITVISNATNGPNSIPVSGTGVNSLGTRTVFVTDNGTLQFGNVQTGNTASGTLTVYNPSGTSYNIVGITLPAGFSGTFSGTVAAYGSVSISITFAPTSAVIYSGVAYVSFNTTVAGTNSLTIVGTGIATGAVVSLTGNLAFGDVPVSGSVQALLNISNIGTTAFTVTSISYPSGFSGNFAGTIAAGATQIVPVTFSPTSAIYYSGNLTVNFSGTVTGTNTFPLSGTGFDLPQPLALVAGQFVTIADLRNGITYYNYYTVVSMNGTALVLQAIDTTGTTPAGLTLPADGRQFFTIDANEAGETQVVGAQMNGPIFNVVPQGDYAYMFKERSIQSIQYTGLGNGTFFIHNEVHGEGLISRYAFIERSDGVIIFLGHKELYAYQGGPVLTPVCQQTTEELFTELDRSRLNSIRIFENENAHEIWIKYPVAGGFRVLIWNYIEDSSAFDDYDPSLEFSALGLIDWATSQVWNQIPPSVTWESLSPTQAWQDMAGGTVAHVPILAGGDGSLLIYGLNYDRDGEGYVSVSETMDFDFQDADIWKYCDTIVIGLQVLQPVPAGTMMTIQVCGQGSLGATLLEYDSAAPQQTGMWSAPQQVLVDGTAPVPVKVNPGGAGRYMRVRFMSNAPDVQWRVSSFEIHGRQGGLY